MPIFKQKQTSPASGVPDYTPGPVDEAVKKEYFERGSKAVIEKNRWFVIAILLGAGLVGSVFAMLAMLPLKTVDTVIVRQADTGRLVADTSVGGTWEPDQDATAYFLNQWLGDVYSINASTIRKTQASAAEMVTGLAVAQLSDLYHKENPILALSQNPLIFRDREFISINFIKSDTALIRYRLTTRLDATHPADVRSYAMTITFVKIKPSTREDVMRNPGGIFITNFSNSEESIK